MLHHHILPLILLQSYPNEELPEFKPEMVRLYEEFLSFAQKLMEVMGYALKLNVC